MSVEKYSKINNVALVIMAGIAIAGALVYTRPVLVPFVFAVFLYAVASPAVRWLRCRLKWPQGLAVTVTVLIFLVLVGGLVQLVAGSFEEFLRGADIYREKVVEFLKSSSALLTRMGFEMDSRVLRAELKQLPIFSLVKNLTGDIATFMGNSILAVIFFLFLILGERPQQQIELVEEIKAKVSRYVFTKFLMSLATGVLVGLILWACGVELVLMFAVLTLLLNFIPSIGSMIAVVLPLPIVILQFGLGWEFAVVLIGSSIVQFSIGNVIEPKLMGESMDLHPVVILVFLMFWGMIWGLAGMFLAVPITALLKIILSRIETTRPLSELFAGRLQV